MSNHNPHGHLSQPNSSWNPLQVPSYIPIPRQPQLAHMSNERPLSRSPLTWHTPTPPDALYNFISANHKNLEINPLLPQFPRAQAPFGTVDLSLQTARNTSSPSARNLSTPPLPPDYTHNKQISHSLSSNNFNNSNFNPSLGVIQATGNIRENFTNMAIKNGVDTDTDGNKCVRDAIQISIDPNKMGNREPEEALPDEPVELIKDSIYHHHAKSNISIIPLQRLEKEKPPIIDLISPKSPSPQTEESLIDVAVVNTSNSKETPDFRAENTHSTLCTISSDNNTINSNDDSLDSTGSKTRRKRKPTKTMRTMHEVKETGLSNFKNVDIAISKNSNNPVENSDIQATSIARDVNISCDVPLKERTVSVKAVEAINAAFLLDSIKNSSLVTLGALVNDESSRQQSMSSAMPCQQTSPTRKNESLQKITVDVDHSEIVKTNNPVETSPCQRITRKGDSDDSETIDKIAAMIASSSTVDEAIAKPENDISSNLLNAQVGKLETHNETSTKMNDLTELLATEPTNNVQNGTTLKSSEPIKESCFEEVENKLEEMFAGIEDERPSRIETSNIPPTDSVISDLGLDLPLVDKTETIFQDKKQKARTSTQQNTNNTTQKRSHSKSETSTPKKKRKIVRKSSTSFGKKYDSGSGSGACSKSKQNNKSTKTNDKVSVRDSKSKDETSTESKYRGPYVHVKKDGSIAVINAPSAEDDVEKQNRAKKALHLYSSSDRSKIRGLHVSTLSMKYDSDTTDTTWMCVFCKKGPHKMGLGDLFGPYIVTTTCEEFEYSQKDPLEDDFISKRTKAEMFKKGPSGIPIVPASNALFNAVTSPSTSSGKKKRKTSESACSSKQLTSTKEIYIGMTKVSDTSYEVWMHEDCAAWSPGVHIIGARVVGLETAVWSCTRYRCSVCCTNGATICCLHRGCQQMAHIPCARLQNWDMDDNEYKSYCETHATASTS